MTERVVLVVGEGIIPTASFGYARALHMLQKLFALVHILWYQLPPWLEGHAGSEQCLHSNSAVVQHMHSSSLRSCTVVLRVGLASILGGDGII